MKTRLMSLPKTGRRSEGSLLHIAHDCNLACRYCFAEEGEYHGRRALMSFEVGKKALDFLIANPAPEETWRWISSEENLL